MSQFRSITFSKDRAVNGSVDKTLYEEFILDAEDALENDKQFEIELDVRF